MVEVKVIWRLRLS